MTDETALARAHARATRAQLLLGDELLVEAFKTLEDGYVQAWRSTTVEEVAAREKLFLAINIVGKVRDHLTKIVSDGKLADAEMRHLLETAERKKRFGIV